MKKTLLVLLSSDFLLLFGLLVAEAAQVKDNVFIYAAVLLFPSAFGVLFFKLFGEKADEICIKPPPSALQRTFLSFFPTLALCLLTSLLTVGFFALFGLHKVKPTLQGSLLRKIVYYALLPAVGEEVLFRFLPLRYLRKYGEKITVWFSAFLFAVCHADFFTIPYAFVMGLIFMAVDMEENSIFPSLLFHFGINLISIFLAPYSGEWRIAVFYTATVLLLGALCVFRLAKRDLPWLIRCFSHIRLKPNENDQKSEDV